MNRDYLIKKRKRKLKEKKKETKKETKKEQLEFKCNACMKVFVKEKYFNNHINKNIVCKNWIENSQSTSITHITKGIHLLISDLLDLAITDNGKIACNFCKSTFSTRGNHHKHYITSTVCNNLAYAEFKKLVINFNT